MAQTGGPDLTARIERHVEEALADLPVQERITCLEDIAGQFGVSTHDETGTGQYPDQVNRLIGLLLGKSPVDAGLSQEELTAKMAGSLNTIFDSLNRTIGIINSTLVGQTGELETIRGIIGSEIAGGHKGQSLEEHLGLIQEAFLVAHKAFGLACENMVGQILTELDPEKIEALSESRLKFGPMRKAELFDIYREKFLGCKGSFASGRLMEEFMRDFERVCRTLYKTEPRRTP